MKNAFYSLLVCALTFSTISCSDDNDNNASETTVTQINNTVTSGSWRVTNYAEDGVDHTSDFTGYNFTFSSENVLTANNGTNTYNGIWTATNDDDSNNEINFNIFFGSPDNFAELSEDWDIIERTSTKLRLRDDSSDGSTDYLTFEKN